MPMASKLLKTLDISSGRSSCNLAAAPALAISLALITLPGVANAAEQTVTHTVAGSWQSTDFRDPAKSRLLHGRPRVRAR